MKDYKIELHIQAPEGLDIDDLWHKLCVATKHSELNWWIGSVLEVSDADEEL